jgi:Holliday junction DNA helicase RuvA
MIGSLQGIVELRDTPYLLINVQGVGYKVLVSASILDRVKLQDKIKLFTYTHVREDILELFGFSEHQDLKLFERLLSVSGIGPKTAIAVFSVGSSQEIVQAIMKSDVDFFTSVPRLGRKNAQKLIIELKGKFASLKDLELGEEVEKEHSDIVLALKSFGFSQDEAKEAIKGVKGEGASPQEKIRLALRYLGK